ncbi:hypothetical protein A3J41_01795 [candidate division TM6 bacterium RIFCSPHIGHO2_12_FULL_38_8]|nr:MAG: hypothetical protein A3J41_01795 [candidate division TM6 bacterium RIFCSPHIGHO2_12_FULL_38_8]
MQTKLFLVTFMLVASLQASKSPRQQNPFSTPSLFKTPCEVDRPLSPIRHYPSPALSARSASPNATPPPSPRRFNESIKPDWLSLHTKNTLLNPIIIKSNLQRRDYLTDHALTSTTSSYLCIVTFNENNRPVMLKYQKGWLREIPKEKMFKTEKAAIDWTIKFLTQRKTDCCC